MSASSMSSIVSVRHLSAFYGTHQAVKDISFEVSRHQVLAMIGPSGCGKSTALRCLNRMHEEIKNSRVTGQVILDGKNIYDAGVDPVQVRSQIGMVFQKPNPFPSFSIWENVAAGYLLLGKYRRSELEPVVEAALHQAGLWDEVKDKLKAPGTSLSGGQQQRLCIARALAVKPPVLLMDEPTSALDPLSTQRIEDLVQELKTQLTVVIVTHNLQQAARISDATAFMYMGDLIELGSTTQIFTHPAQKKTEDYITGRFG